MLLFAGIAQLSESRDPAVPRHPALLLKSVRPGNGTGVLEGGRREGRWKKRKRRRWRRLHRTTGWPAQETGKSGKSGLPLGIKTLWNHDCMFITSCVCVAEVFLCRTSVRVDNNLCVLSRVVQQSDRQWDMSLSFSLTGGSRIWTSLRPAQSSSHQPSKSLSSDRVSLCSS